MIGRSLFAVAVRLGGALLLNALLLIVLAALNRAEEVDADPVAVARLRLPELPARRPPHEVRLPEKEPEPDEPVLVEPRAPAPPQAEIEPIALPSVQLGVNVPVVVRPLPVVARRPAPRRAPRTTPRTPAPRRTLDSDEVDEPPREAQVRSPAYPRSAIRREIEGSATVKLLIDEQGRVVDVKLVDTRGSPLFGQAVLAVARGWRFVPARDDGKCVRVWALKTIHFQLRTRP